MDAKNRPTIYDDAINEMKKEREKIREAPVFKDPEEERL